MSEEASLSRFKTLSASVSGRYRGFNEIIWNKEAVISGSVLNAQILIVPSADPEAKTSTPGATAMQLIELS